MCQDMVGVTLTGLRLASSAAVAGNAAATGAGPGGDNGFISSIQVGLVAPPEPQTRGGTQNLDQLHQPNHRLQQIRGISWPGGELQR